MARRRPRPPRRPGRLTKLALAASLLAPPAAALVATPAAAQVTLLTNRGYLSGTTIDWGALGPPYTAVPSPTVLAVPGNPITLTNATGGDMERRDQVPCEYWDGDFTSCDRLLWTNSAPGTGPLQFEFTSPITGGFGVNIQSDDRGPFTAFLTLYSGGSPLGTVIRHGISGYAGDGSAPFIGAGSVSSFDGVVIGLVSAGVDPGDFAINGPTFGSVVPEPASLALLGGGLAVLGALRRPRRRGPQASR
jgi:hypothetical protein